MTLKIQDPRFNGGMYVITTNLHWSLRILGEHPGVPCVMCGQKVEGIYLDFTNSGVLGVAYCPKCWCDHVAMFRRKGMVYGEVDTFLDRAEEFLVNAALTGEPKP